MFFSYFPCVLFHSVVDLVCLWCPWSSCLHHSSFFRRSSVRTISIHLIVSFLFHFAVATILHDLVFLFNSHRSRSRARRLHRSRSIALLFGHCHVHLAPPSTTAKLPRLLWLFTSPSSISTQFHPRKRQRKLAWHHSGESSGSPSYKTVLLIALHAVVHLELSRIDGIRIGLQRGNSAVVVFRLLESNFLAKFVSLCTGCVTYRDFYGWSRRKKEHYPSSVTKTKLCLDAYCAFSFGAMAKRWLDCIWI